MEYNLIIRLAIGSGDVTFLASRADYIELYKRGARIIYAIEYPDAETAAREIVNK